MTTINKETPEIRREIILEKNVTANLNGNLLKIKGPKGEVERSFVYPGVSLSIGDNKIAIIIKKDSKKEKMIIGSYEAHIVNMVRGVQELFVYKLKICSGHFPMSVTASGKEFVVKNFLGETVPRKVGLLPDVEVKINGVDIVVSSPDREAAGLMSGKIESLCRITNRDIRIFQDGVYIVEKPGKQVK